MSANDLRRSPHGERGLKLLDNRSVYGLNRSLSSWRAWIEITVWYAR